MNIKNMLKVVVVVVAVYITSLVLTSTPSFALGKLGHQLTCQLAFEQLSLKSQQEVMRLLNTMPTAALTHLNKFNHHENKSPITFAKACTWADAIKKEAGFEQFKSWHYLNVKRNVSVIDKESCPSDCITQAVIYHQKQLKTAKSDQQRRQALMFLGHWLGDIHQPLHVSFSSDLGGNKTKIVSNDGNCTNLHWLWDQCLLTRQIETKDYQERYEYLYRKLTKSLTLNIQNESVTRWQNDNVYTWATESLEIARQPKFGYCSISKEQVCEVNNPQPYTLMAGYQTHYSPVINQQIIKASVRLANHLEQSL